MRAARRDRPAWLYVTGVLAAALLVFQSALLVARSSPVDAPDRVVSAQAASLTASRPAWLGVVRFVTSLGSTAVLAAVAVVGLLVLIRQRRWRSALVLAGTCLTGSVLTTLIKLAVHRARPPDRIIHAIGYSFPSGHTTNSTVVYGAVLSIVFAGAARPLRLATGVAGAVVVLAVGTSRIVLNAHWLSDVVGGLALGTALLCVCFTVDRTVTARDPDGPAASLTSFSHARDLWS